jgi:spore germination protein KC
MKILKFSILIICMLPLCGCFNYRDMNKLFFATALLVDIDETGSPVIYCEAFKANRGEAQENGTEIKVIFTGTGKTIFDAFNNLLLSSSSEINASQIKALIFSERAAEEGLDKFLDIFEKDQKPTVRMFLFIYSAGDVEDLLDLYIKDEQFLGLFLENFMSSQGRLAHIYRIRLNEYLNERLLGSMVSVIPIIKKSRDLPERIKIEGAAVTQNDKIVAKLSPDEIVSYNYLTNNNNPGVLLADNPNEKDQFVSLKVLKNNEKTTITYDGNIIHVSKKVRLITTLVESQRSSFVLNDTVRKQIETSAEKKLRYMCIKLFNDYKNEGIDIYNITRKFEIKYSDSNVKDVLSISELRNLDIDIQIDGSNNNTDFK